MRSLLVAHNVPWPAHGGGLVRLAQVVQALASVSELDLFVFHEPRQTKLVLPASMVVHRSIGVPYPRTSHQLRWRPQWAMQRGIPIEVARVQADRHPRHALREWARPPYGVVWFSTAETYAWTGRPSLGRTVVDMMDLEDQKAELRAEFLGVQARSDDGGISIRSRLAQYQTRINARDWRRFQRSVATHVVRVVVSSELDAVRSGLAEVTVVPNSYPRPRDPVGDPTSERPPVLMFQGDLSYPPNIDAAAWLVHTIAPRVRAAIPATEVRLVGQPAASILELHRPGVVTVTGQVRSMEIELAGAAVAVVPVRFGSGTRVKILESFAHRIPVVSTTIGAEGLEVEDGVHLLLADDPAQFAAATVRLLRDAELRLRLTSAAEELCLNRYDGRVADERVRGLVEEIAG